MSVAGSIETRPLTAKRAGALAGRVRVPGDKSTSHRALILGLLSIGETRIDGLLEGDDVLRTAQACRQLGATVERHAPGPLERARHRASAASPSPTRFSISAMPAPARG